MATPVLLTLSTDGAIRFSESAASGLFAGPWTAVGDGDAGSRPAVGLHADGTASIFWRTTAGDLVTARRLPDGTWSPGAETLATPIDGDPTVDDTGYPMIVLARASGALLVVAADAQDGGVAAPAALDGTLAGDPVVARNADRRAEVFARAADGTIVHQWQDFADGPFTGVWAVFPGAYVGDPAVVTGADGRMVLAVVDDTGELSVWVQDTQNGPFSDVAMLGRPFGPSPTLAVSARGTLLLAAASLVGAASTVVFEQATPDGGFQPSNAGGLPAGDSRAALGFDALGDFLVVRRGTALLQATITR